MSTWFDINAAAPNNRVEGVLKAVFKQMSVASAKLESTSLIHLGLWHLKKLLVFLIEKYFLKNVKAIFIPKIRLDLVPFNRSEFSKKVMLK